MTSIWRLTSSASGGYASAFPRITSLARWGGGWLARVATYFLLKKTHRLHSTPFFLHAASRSLALMESESSIPTRSLSPVPLPRATVDSLPHPLSDHALAGDALAATSTQVDSLGLAQPPAAGTVDSSVVILRISYVFRFSTFHATDSPITWSITWYVDYRQKERLLGVPTSIDLPLHMPLLLDLESAADGGLLKLTDNFVSLYV